MGTGSIDIGTQTAIAEQFANGYNFFKVHAQQPSLGFVYVNLILYPWDPESPSSPSSNKDVRTDVFLGNGEPVARLYCPADLLEGINVGYFLHEGAECAYVVTRFAKQLPSTPYAGDFVGNLARAEITGKIPSHQMMIIEGRQYEVTTTSSINELNRALSAYIRKEAAERGLPEAYIAEILRERTGYTGINARLKKCIEANDLIQDYWLGKEDPTSRDPFLRFLAEENYPPDKRIRELFTVFKGK